MSELNFINLTTTEVLETFKNAFYAQYGSPIKIGSEEFAASTVFSYCMTVLFAAMNDSAKQRFLATMTGDFLDALAATYGITERPQGSKATCLVNVTMQSQPIQPSAYEVGTLKVSDEAGHTFENVERFLAPERGRIETKSVRFRAIEVGTDYNNIPAGEIKKIVTPLPGILLVQSTTMTDGGTDPMTDDDTFRAWLKNEIESFAGAGTAEAYRGKAMNVDSRIIDVQVLGQEMKGYEKGKVQIYVLADAEDVNEIVAYVQEACSDRTFRPVGDYVITRPAVSCPVSPVGVFHITYPMRFQTVAIERTNRIISEYREYLSQKINRPFVYGTLIDRLLETDSDGVFATEAVVMGLSEEDNHPIYPPEVGGYIALGAVTLRLHYVETDA